MNYFQPNDLNSALDVLKNNSDLTIAAGCTDLFPITNDISLDKNLSLRMRYPSLNQFIENNFEVEEEAQTFVNKTFRLIADCIDTVFTEDEAWEGKD